MVSFHVIHIDARFPDCGCWFSAFPRCQRDQRKQTEPFPRVDSLFRIWEISVFECVIVCGTYQVFYKNKKIPQSDIVF